MDNALIIDLVLAAVLAVFALLGARKGLIRSLMALVSVVVALIGATLLTAMFVEPVTDLVYPKVEERVLEQFERDIPSDALAAEDGDLSAGGLLPDELSDLLGEALDTLKRFGVSDDAIDGVTKSVTDSAVSAAELPLHIDNFNLRQLHVVIALRQGEHAVFSCLSAVAAGDVRRSRA